MACSDSTSPRSVATIQLPRGRGSTRRDRSGSSSLPLMCASVARVDDDCGFADPRPGGGSSEMLRMVPKRRKHGRGLHPSSYSGDQARACKGVDILATPLLALESVSPIRPGRCTEQDGVWMLGSRDEHPAVLVGAGVLPRRWKGYRGSGRPAAGLTRRPPGESGRPSTQLYVADRAVVPSPRV